MIDKSIYTDLTGDPVYDQLLTKLNPGNTVIGGHIITKKIAAPNEARKVISILVLDPNGNEKVFTFNYKKFMARHL